MNNKYLSGLLAGVLTAGAVQGSGNEGKMPEMGEKQTPVVRAQTANELPADLQELLLAFSQSLAERGYRAQIDLSAIQMPTQITSINTSALNGNNGVQSNINAFELPEMVLSEPERPSVPTELTQLTIGENGEIKEVVVKGQSGKKSQLDPFHMQIVQQYMGHTKNEKGKSGTTEDLMNTIQVNSKFEDQPERNRINTIPVTEKNKKMFPQLNTQQIFGPNDYIMPGMYQYIFKYPVAKEDIKKRVNELQDKHTGKALKDGKKPIVFEYQLLPDFWNGYPQGEIMTERPNDLFEIKKYYIDTYTSQWTLEKHDNRDHLRNLGKPIIFKEIDTVQPNRDDAYLKDILDPAGAKAQLYKFNENGVDYEKYCELIQKYPAISNRNLVFPRVQISGQSREEQMRQLKVLSMDKRVFVFDLKYQTPNLMGLVSFGNVKSMYAITINPNDLQKQRSVTFGFLQQRMQLGNRKLYNFHGFRWKNDVISEAVKKYVQYVNDNNLEYLSGFVNFANKPSYLTEEEWRKVIVLTGMVEELMDLVDQKFNEYEANPYAAPAADPYGCGGNYGCDGYGCAGYNPYGQYYYGYSYSYGC